MKNNYQIDMSRIEELESKEYLTPEEFRELGHFRMINVGKEILW